jgi:hypothetical protein
LKYRNFPKLIFTRKCIFEGLVERFEKVIMVPQNIRKETTLTEYWMERNKMARKSRKNKEESKFVK